MRHTASNFVNDVDKVFLSEQNANHKICRSCTANIRCTWCPFITSNENDKSCKVGNEDDGERSSISREEGDYDKSSQ